ncbi:unnamed protein product, partial [Iphiclides podalirius]
MKGILEIVCFYFIATNNVVFVQHCGCRDMNPCYKRMLETLLDDNEEPCVENSEIGTISITVFLKALEAFCGKIVTVYNQSLTYQKRNLYEVVLDRNDDKTTTRSNKPVIFLDAGQQGGVEPVNFALIIIEQLVGCKEHNVMSRNVRWVILPNTNPDGREFTRFNIMPWRKNVRLSDDNKINGVDITRNFDDSFHDCGLITNGYSPEFQGNKPLSESESVFITTALNKYKNKLRAYLSIRRDGHALLYPYASTNNTAPGIYKLQEKAAEIVSKVNHKSGFIEMLVTTSINEMNGRPQCGHSVDYVFNKFNQPYAYEMRVYLENDHRMMKKFQALPRGYDTTLKVGYLSVIKELYNLVISEHRNRTFAKRVI